MKSYGVFSELSKEESDKLVLDQKIKHVMREHFNTNEPVTVEMIDGDRIYKVGNHIVRLCPSFWNDGCELMSGTRWDQIAFSDFQADPEIYSKLQLKAHCELMNPALSDYCILNSHIIVDALHKYRVLENLVTASPNLRCIEGLIEIIKNKSGSYEFKGNLTTQLLDVYLSSVGRVESHITEIVHKHLGNVHKDLFFRSDIVKIEFINHADDNRHFFLNKDFRVSIANALERACIELANSFKDTEIFTENLIQYQRENQENVSYSVSPVRLV